MTLKKGCKCIYCHWYMPKVENKLSKGGIRCWGFKAEDIRKCIREGYSCFKGRNTKI